jgi:DNA topoisomerase I
MKKLVVVESPSKAKKIQGYLGSGWQVLASMGHLRDLPLKALGVDVDAGFAPSYEAARGKGKVIAQLRKAAAEADELYLATDPDREGEAIAWHVLEAVGRAVKGKPVFRVVFHEITKKAIQAAFEKPRPLDMNLVNSQQARRVLDRLVGWKVSPVLGSAFGTSLSAGRVQSVAVRLVAEREQEIQAFKPEQYWTLEARYARRTAAREEFAARLARLLLPADKELDPARLPTARVHEIAAELEPAEVEWHVRGVETKERQRRPPPPFITSTLQQKASSTLNLNPKRAMQVAQKLYEMGRITYMRTDSPSVAREAQQAARTVISEIFGDNALPSSPPFYRSKGNAQEAHECIRPTDPSLLPKNAPLSGEEAALYRLIWMRFIASQMRPALYDVTTATIEPSRAGRALPYHFHARGSVLRDVGWLAVYGVQPGAGDDEDEADEPSQVLPPLDAGEALDLRALTPEEHWTQPPPRYTEPSLIKALEKEGVGRPSTYATIMETIQKRGYVERKGKSLLPTESGRVVTGFLTAQFPDLLDIGFTRRMEDDLDRVAEGEVVWTSLLEGFYQPLEARIAAARQVQPAQSLAEPCPECGAPLEEKYGRYGKYRLCAACGYKPGAAKATGRSCPTCGKELMQRKSKRGPFLGCSGYPACTYTENLQSKGVAPQGQDNAPVEEIPCPDCGKPLVARRGRYGPFLGCSGYPACRHIQKVQKATASRSKG